MKKKPKRAPRPRRARPLLTVAAGMTLAAIGAGCGPDVPACGNAAYCGPVLDMSVPAGPDLLPNGDGGH